MAAGADVDVETVCIVHGIALNDDPGCGDASNAFSPGVMNVVVANRDMGRVRPVSSAVGSHGSRPTAGHRFIFILESGSPDLVLLKDEVIATFLAILELIKMREIFVAQKDFFSEIEIIRNPEVVKKSE